MPCEEIPFTPAFHWPLVDLSSPVTAENAFFGPVLLNVVCPMTPELCAATPRTPGPFAVLLPATHGLWVEQLVKAWTNESTPDAMAGWSAVPPMSVPTSTPAATNK